MKQLVEAVIEIHSKGVFHNDLKPEHILCGPGGPHIKILDFGCGTFFYVGMYTTLEGTNLSTCPEWFLLGSYKAEPATVWQLGIVLFIMLHNAFPFQDMAYIIRGETRVRDDISFYCRHFLESCLSTDPAERPTLKSLRYHPWLMFIQWKP